MEKKNIFLFIWAILINFAFSQLVDFKVGDTKDESIANNRFYSIELTDRLSEYLIINVKPTDNYEKYSDPDIFVSSINSYPSNLDLAEWYSVSVGEDMLPIPNSALVNSTHIYVAVKCKSQCDYKISIYYENKVELFAGDYFMLQFSGSETSRIFHYNHTSSLTKKFEIFALAAKSDDLLVNIHYVYGLDTTKTIIPVQSWYNGYSAVIDTTFYFPCASCFFRIELTTKVDTQVILGINLKNVVSPLEQSDVAIGTINSLNDTDCYNISSMFTNSDANDKTPYILSAHSYLEFARIYLTTGFNDTQGDKNYGFQKDIVIKLYPQELKNHLICVSSTIEQTSYVFTLIKEVDIEKTQRYNFLVNGMNLYGYLPGNNVTAYKHMKIDVSSSNLNLDLKVVKGNPILYAYVCMDYNDCYFDQSKVEVMSKTGGLFSSSNVNGNYHISIPNEINACVERAKQTGKNEMCSALAIVYCQGIEECGYLVSLNFDKDLFLLKNKVKTSRFVPKDRYNYYKIENLDNSIQKITVVVHSHTGDADLFASRVYKNPENDEDKFVSNTVGNRDVIEFENLNKEDITGNSTLVGNFYIAVKGYTPSYYTVYYFTSSSNNGVDNNYRSLESGFIYSELVNKKDGIKVFKFFNRDISNKSPFLISFNSLNCEGEAYYMKNENTQETSFQLDSSYHHSQYLVTKEADFYGFIYGYNFGFKVTSLDSSSNSATENCLIYVGGLEMGREFVLNEGVPHIYTIPNEGSMSYVYPHAFDDNAAIIFVYFEQAGKITMTYRIGSAESTLTIIKPNGSLINKEELKKNCNTSPCNIHINITSDASNNVPVTYKILGKSSNNKPVYLSKGLIKHDSTTPSVYQYYYTDVALGDSGEINLHIKHGNAELVGKIVRKNAIKEVNADYINVKLPKIGDYETLNYNPTTMSISFNSTDTKGCTDGCQIFFGVYSKDKFSYNDYLVDYTVSVKTDGGATNLPLDYNVYGKINNTDTLNFYKVRVREDADQVSFTMDCLESPCEVYINYGEKFPTSTIHTWKMTVDANQQNKITISVIDDWFLKNNLVRNLKDTVFTIGIGPTLLNSIQYHFYVAVHKTGKDQIYEIIPSTPQVCEVANDNDYCDFMMHLTSTVGSKLQQMAFYPKVISNYKTQDFNIEFFAKTVNASEYFSIKNGLTKRPRYGDNEIYSNGVYGKPIFQYTTTGAESILLLSIKLGQKGTFSLLSTIISEFEGPLKLPKVSLDYLVFIPSEASIEINVGSRGSTFMTVFTRVLGKGRIDYTNNKNARGTFIIEKNSTTSQISIQDHNVNLKIQNKNSAENLILIFRYEPNLARNLDRIHLGPSQTIYYPHDKGGFPLAFYLPLKGVLMDITVNIKIKEITYIDEIDNNDLFLDHHITGTVIDSSKIYDLTKNDKFTGLPALNGVHIGAYDTSLRTARITIPAGQYSNRSIYNSTSSHAIFSLEQGAHNKKAVKSFIIQILAFPENSLHYNITLPQKIYYYSMIDTRSMLDSIKESQAKSGHVYKLQKEHAKENFMVIELASCSGLVNYALRDIDSTEEVLIDKNPSLLLNRTKHQHLSYDHYGKKIVEIQLENNNKDLVLVVFPREAKQESICDEAGSCYFDHNVEYAVKYRSFTDRSQFVKYELGDKGLVSSKVSEDNNVHINAEKLSTSNVNYQTKVSYFVRLFYSESLNHQMSKFYSICFAHKTAKVYKFYTAPNQDVGFELDKFPVNVEYVISVLAQVEEHDENYGSLLVYSPINTNKHTTSSAWMSVIFVTISLVLFVFVLLIYRKYRQTKIKLDYEVNDVRNLASLPRSAGQIAELRTVKAKEKYTSLNDDHSSDSIHM